MPPALRRVLPFITAALALVVIYDAATFYFRWRAIQQDQERGVERAAEDAKKTIDMLGGDHLKILSFYASPGVIHPGESTSLCYGVNAAAKVTITPDVGTAVYPAYTRCLQVAPKTTTEYTLTAEDSSGKKTTGVVKVGVSR